MACSNPTNCMHSYSEARRSTPLEQSLSSTEQDRRDCDVQLIDRARTKILLYGIGPTTNLHVHPARWLARLVKSLVNAACDEIKCRVAFHLYGPGVRDGSG